MKKIFFLFIIPFVFSTSCVIESKCWSVSCVETINFKLVDRTTQKDLVFGLNPIYSTDSMFLSKKPTFAMGMDQNFLSSVNGNYLGLQTITGHSALDTSYLRLSHNDIDTLIIKYVYESNVCCKDFIGYGKIASIKYNGQVTNKSAENYIFEK